MTLLLGLASVAIPIIIHLLNRRKARVVDWGAMRFLLASLASRNRRIMIEEIILLAVRCLLLAVVVLALARPFLPSQSNVPWAFVLPAVMAAALAAGASAAVWHKKRWRWGLLGLAGAMLALAGSSTAIEGWLQDRRWTSGAGEKDVAIVIDASMSMSIQSGGKTNFQRAIDEAKIVLAACAPGDAISIILAGSTPQPIIANPTSDRKEVAAALNSLTPGNGSMKALEAVETAVTSLVNGRNPAKKIVVITDGQSVGWDVNNDFRWQFLGSSLKSGRLPSRPRIVCRTLPLPAEFHNAMVSDVTLARKVIGTDRKVQIDVKIANTGSDQIAPQSVELSIDGGPAIAQKVGEIQAGAAETVRFEHRFDKPGRHVLIAAIKTDDDLPADNSLWRVVDVSTSLPVLIIDGSPSPVRLRGAADFMAIALDPSSGGRLARPANVALPDDDAVGCMVSARIVPVTDLPAISRLSDYSVVILANVPSLPRKFADDLDRFVRTGGGLYISAGDRADCEFYNHWTSQWGESICPAVFDPPERAVPAQPARMDLKSLSHPALAMLADSSQSDAASVRVGAYWPLKVDEKSLSVRLAGLLDTGQPAVVERKLGKGSVLLSSFCLDRQDSNSPGLNCFVPLLHEMMYYLAGPTVADNNVQPGTEVTVDVSTLISGRATSAPAVTTQAGPSETIDVVGPDGTHQPALVGGSPDAPRASFNQTGSPGLYRFIVPPAWYGLASANPGDGVPFVVLGDSEESRLMPLSPTDFERIARRVDFFHAQSSDELAAAVGGSVPGEELWKYLAIGAMLILLAETALARWIAIQRQTNAAKQVTFGSPVLDARHRRRTLQKK